MKIIIIFCIVLLMNSFLSCRTGKAREKIIKERLPRPLQVRIRPLANKGQRRKMARWVLDGYTTHDILKLIEDLKPDVLERYIAGSQDPDLLLPASKGHSQMNVIEFLNASMKAGAPGCIITPRVSLHLYDMGIFWSTCSNLYNLPIDPPMRTISLDNWGDFGKRKAHSDATIIKMLKRLKKQGWEHIAANYIGGHVRSDDIIEIGEFGSDNSKNFEPKLTKLAKLKQEKSITQILMYIDFPGQVNEFMEFPPDRRADILIKKIHAAQAKHNFSFVWPILQDRWQSTKVFTSKTGPYKGASLYELMKSVMRK